MAKMVTRTFVVTEIKVMGFDMEANTTAEKVVKISGVVADEKAMLKIARKHCENEGFKVLKAEVIEVKETLYGMTESKFIEMAEVLPPRTISKKEEA